LGEADRVLEQAQKILDELTADYPDIPEHWAGVGGILNNRAAIQERRGDLPRAAALFEQAAHRLRHASRLSCQAMEPRQFLAQTLDSYARVLRALDRHDEAVRATRERRELGTTEGTQPLATPPPAGSPNPNHAPPLDQAAVLSASRE
jgi:tetratricopeptide (TPR) repeat protein